MSCPIEFRSMNTPDSPCLYLTPQEHLFIGSTPRSEDIEFGMNVPVLLQRHYSNNSCKKSKEVIGSIIGDVSAGLEALREEYCFMPTMGLYFLDVGDDLKKLAMGCHFGLTSGTNSRSIFITPSQVKDIGMGYMNREKDQNIMQNYFRALSNPELSGMIDRFDSSFFKYGAKILRENDFEKADFDTSGLTYFHPELAVSANYRI